MVIRSDLQEPPLGGFLVPIIWRENIYARPGR